MLNNAIYVYDLREKHYTRLPGDPRYEDYAPFFSPSGKKIAFTRRENQNHTDEIFVATWNEVTRSWVVQQITKNNKADWYPIFLTENLIVYSKKPEWFWGDWLKDDDLVIMDLTTGSIRPLVDWWFSSEADPYPLKGTDWLVFISASRLGAGKYKLYAINYYKNEIIKIDFPREVDCRGPAIFIRKNEFSRNVTASLTATDKELQYEYEAIKVISRPNPIRSENTTTFSVVSDQNASITGLKIDVFDLTGKLVFSEETSELKLVWHGKDLTNSLLANGVYIYVAHVKVNGKWITLTPQKIVILR
ncbi:MAG: hypothetical protein ABDI20_08160 [Candidatus Bipolaricaulaceae bacterium]